MAQAFRFICNSSGETIESWDEGDPYYLDERGRKQYAYHPDPKRDSCIGIDSPYLCLSCAETFSVDSRSPIAQCPECSSTSICDTYDLEGKNCPFCQKGILERHLGGVS
jgi:DNA-directed RNA polymerase subunit RPC12/RpoP